MTRPANQTTAMVSLLLLCFLSLLLPSLPLGCDVSCGGRDDAGIKIHPHLFNNQSRLSSEKEGSPFSSNCPACYGPITEEEFILTGRETHHPSASPDHCPAQYPGLRRNWTDVNSPLNPPASINDNTSNVRSESGCTETPPSVGAEIPPSVGAEIPPSVAMLKADILPTVDVVKADIQPTVDVVKADILPAVDVVKADILPTVDVVKADIQPAVDVVKADILPTVDVVKADSQPTVDVVKADILPAVDVVKASMPPSAEAEVLPCHGPEPENDKNIAVSSFTCSHLVNCLRAARDETEQCAGTNSSLGVEILAVTSTFPRLPNTALSAQPVLSHNESRGVTAATTAVVRATLSSLCARPASSNAGGCRGLSLTSEVIQTNLTTQPITTAHCNNSSASWRQSPAFVSAAAAATLSPGQSAAASDDRTPAIATSGEDVFIDDKDDDVGDADNSRSASDVGGQQGARHEDFILADNADGDECPAGHVVRAESGVDNRMFLAVVTTNGSEHLAVSSWAYRSLRNATSPARALEAVDTYDTAVPAERMTSDPDFAYVTFKDDWFEAKAPGLYLVAVSPEESSGHIYITFSQHCATVAMETLIRLPCAVSWATGDGRGETVDVKPVELWESVFLVAFVDLSNGDRIHVEHADQYSHAGRARKRLRFGISPLP